MASFTRTSRAEEDLIEIWEFIADDNATAADHLLDRIDEACWLLAENPRLGPARPDLHPSLRYFSVEHYLILYRERPGGVDIVRILHGARDLSALLRDR